MFLLSVIFILRFNTYRINIYKKIKYSLYIHILSSLIKLDILKILSCTEMECFFSPFTLLFECYSFHIAPKLNMKKKSALKIEYIFLLIKKVPALRNLILCLFFIFSKVFTFFSMLTKPFTYM